MNDDKALWVKETKAKYNIGINPRKWKKKSKSSVVRKAIFGSKNTLRLPNGWLEMGETLVCFKIGGWAIVA